MERLWAPWRMAYIEQPSKTETSGTDGGGNPAAGGCIFCVFPARNDDAATLIVHRGRTCFVILNAFPYNNGHLMVVPYRHLQRLPDLNPEENAEMLSLASLMTEALGDVSHPDGYNIGMNLGAVAGAGIADHLHLHVVPRWGGDTNFMPVIGEVKVMPEALTGVYAKLTQALARRGITPEDREL